MRREGEAPVVARVAVEVGELDGGALVVEADVGFLAGAERAVDDGGEGAVEFTLDTTPFYAESGGQVADTGMLESMPGAGKAKLRVVDRRGRPYPT